MMYYVQALVTLLQLLNGIFYLKVQKLAWDQAAFQEKKCVF